MAGFLSPLTSGTPEAPGGSRARQRRARSTGRQQQGRLPHVPGLIWGRESCFPWPRAQEQGWQGWH